VKGKSEAAAASYKMQFRLPLDFYLLPFAFPE
jgi:hypothetical protein